MRTSIWLTFSFKRSCSRTTATMTECWDGWPDRAHVPVHQLQEVIDQGVRMATANTVSKTSRASAIAEAQALVRRCAEPRPAGDNIKGAIRRASWRTGMPFSRAKNIWYGDARRIEAAEMDRLRRGAENAEIAQA